MRGSPKETQKEKKNGFWEAKKILIIHTTIIGGIPESPIRERDQLRAIGFRKSCIWERC